MCLALEVSAESPSRDPSKAQAGTRVRGQSQVLKTRLMKSGVLEMMGPHIGPLHSTGRLLGYITAT